MSTLHELLSKDYTVESIVGSERFERMQQTRIYRFFSDWSGLATNKVVLGVYMDAKAGLLPGTSAMARGISLLVHTPTSPVYTKVRDWVYEKGNITSDRPAYVRYGAEVLAFNIVQTPLYTAQVAAAVIMRDVLDPTVEVDYESIAKGAFAFFKNSWWLAFAGKWSMDRFRTFFGAKTPEQLADLEKRIQDQV